MLAEAVLVRVVGLAADEDDAHIGVLGTCHLGEVEPIYSQAQVEVDHEHVRHLPRSEQHQGILRVSQDADRDVLFSEKLDEQLPYEFVILDEKNLHRYSTLTVSWRYTGTKVYVEETSLSASNARIPLRLHSALRLAASLPSVPPARSCSAVPAPVDETP